MTEVKGTYSELVELSRQEPPKQARSQPSATPSTDPAPQARPRAAKQEAEHTELSEDLSTTPYISQNYRFTEDELRWLRRQSYTLSERLGMKVSQNTILRIALQRLRDLYTQNPKDNPLVETISKLKK